MIPRSRIIERSLVCFRRGAFSLLPLLGFYFGLRAVRDFYVVTSSAEERWNPGRPHVYAGVLLGMLGLLLNALAVLVLCLVWLRRIEDG